jgi:hypothetical protein
MKLSAVIQQNWSGSSWTPVSQNRILTSAGARSGSVSGLEQSDYIFRKQQPEKLLL